MPVKITAYKCSFGCKGKFSTSKKTIEKHEKNCFRNPVNKACLGCKNFTGFENYDGKTGCDCEKGLMLDATKENKYGLRKNCEGFES